MTTQNPVSMHSKGDLATSRDRLLIQSLHLDEFRCFESVAIDFSPEVTVFLAENGKGKSSILESLARAMSWLVSALLSKDGQGRGDKLSIHDIRVAPGGSSSIDNCSVCVSFALLGKSFDITLRMNLPHSARRVKNDVAAASKIANQLRNVCQQHGCSYSLPLLLYLSPRRFAFYQNSDNPERSKSFLRKRSLLGSYAAYHECLSGTPGSEPFFGWLFAQLRTSRNGADDDQKKQADHKLKSLGAIIRVIWPDFDKFDYLIVDGEEQIAFVVANTQLHLDQLSDGQRMILLTFGEIAWRLIELNSNSPEPLQGSGVVLIDEIEMHLHPKWQQSIIGHLRKSFPNIQFVITTHSPQVVSTVVGKNIRRIATSDIQGKRYSVTPLTEQSQGLSSDDVLERIMDTSASPKDLEQSRWVAQCRSCILQRDFKQAEEILTKIKGHFGATSSEFRLLQSMLTAYRHAFASS